ncbi:MAG TPA: S-adenosylmethionine:tRNA ribosyltransferase-isomerase [Acidimicrobiia bacterium]|nr:S-adenosylmethionine:tRNA ribosyltransferase-isomerase [Acidimicrobiia bacterium]
MTAVRAPVLEFALDAAHEAHEPPEARGVARDAVRLLVSRGDDDPVDTRFRNLGHVLAPGDLLVVNTSATIPAAFDGRLPDGEPVAVHLSGNLPGGLWLVEVRRPHDGATAPLRLEHAVDIALLAGGTVRLLAPFAASVRLWLAQLEVGQDVVRYAFAHGRPIRYRHVERDWPLSAYETIFAREPGSAEMPSASRPFTNRVVTDLVTRGVLVAPLVLHTGVSSLEANERPYPERYLVPATTAATVNAVRAGGGRVVAVGTTVVRALATVTDERASVHPGEGWTEVVVTPENPVASVDGLVTGWHEPESSHLMMLEAFAAAPTLQRAYDAALDLRYLWHEFGDSHLILREQDGRA